MSAKKLGEICNIQSGGTPSRTCNEYWKNGIIPWVKISDFKGKYLKTTDECITEEGLKNSSAKIFPKGTILYTIFATLGEVSILDIEATTNQAIAGLQIIDKQVLSDYLYYYLLSLKDFVNNLGRGVAQNNINMKIIKNLEVPVPTPKDQEKIAEILGRVSNLIDLRKKQLSKLDELVKSRFVEMFGDPVTNEKNWLRLTLGDICEIGSSKRVFEKDYVPSGIPFFRTKEIVELSKGNPISTELFITEEHFAELENSYGTPKKDDLLISAVGTIGTIWIVSGDFEFYFKDGNLIRIKASPNFNSIFMKYLLGELIDNYKKEMSTGTAYSALTIVGLKKMLVYDVPLVLQEQFATFVEQVDKSKIEVKESLEKLETLKKALMQEYFG